MAQSQRADWGDDWGDSDDWGNGGGGAGGRRAPAGKPDYNIVLNDDPSYGRNNYNDSAYPQPPAYGDAHRQLPGQVPAPAANMDYGREAYSSPWYRKKRTWAAAALAIIIVIVVPVAVVVSRNNERENSYPDYSPLNYTLLETYSGDTFFDNFDYFTGYDPAQGFVHYVPEAMAAQYNLTYATSDSAILRVDTSVTNTTVPNASTGRFSVRVQSKTQYPVGTLFLFDVRHTPYGCGTWPALWLTDPAHWPTNGEIDVVEATNQGTSGNTASLHTTKGCDMSGVKRLMTGQAEQGDCYNGTNSNEGCGVEDKSVSSYGAAFNQAGGGVMAVELRDAGIRIWSWARSALPADVAANSATPYPASWGEAFADFPSTDCDISSHFRNQSIIANIDLCGDLVEATWNTSGCASTCTDWVANYPQAFTNAYWEFGAFNVYKAA